MAAGAPDFMATNRSTTDTAPLTAQPLKPVEVSRWWMPGTRVGDAEPSHSTEATGSGKPPLQRLSAAPRPRVSLAIDGGMFILDISDRANRNRYARDNSHRSVASPTRATAVRA
jgi:hypothetical protein